MHELMEFLDMCTMPARYRIGGRLAAFLIRDLWGREIDGANGYDDDATEIYENILEQFRKERGRLND
jgi:hypothetical protein